MKKVMFSFSCILFAHFIMAQSVIVLHSTDTTAVFTGTNAFVNAYALAESGDTMYLSGGSFTVGTEISKGLKIFGAGIHPDSTSATYITQISGDVIIRNGADGLHFEGIQFSDHIYEPYSQVVHFVSFIRCKFDSNLDFGNSGSPSTLRTNYSFIQSIFTNTLDIDGVTNSIVSNCILTGRIYNSNANTIKNSSFLYNPSSSNADLFANSNTNIICNCVFHASSPYIIDGASNTVQSCMFQNATPNLGTSPIVGGSYTGVNLSTIFISIPSDSFSFTDNYHLTTDAETTYLGNEGTQVGIYGGLFPLKEGYVPQNPHVSTKNIASGTDENGFLNVNIEVNAQEE